jgi:two-component system copper resistance phosphate regulon response regulator CusR
VPEDLLCSCTHAGFRRGLIFARTDSFSTRYPNPAGGLNPSSNVKILLVEDEERLASFLRKGILAEGYEVEIAYDGRTGLSLFRRDAYDVIILDVNLPLLNGFELCGRIRSENEQVPILMLTALDSLADKSDGFQAGADDYLVKPFEFDELLLRIRALTRRRNQKFRQTLHLADLELNLATKIVSRAGRRIDLTTREYALLEYLMLNQGKIISRVDISERVWDINYDTNTNIIDVYISYLRKKIDKDFSPKLLHTIVGMGYVLRES